MLSTQVLVKDPDVSDCKQDPTSMVRAVPAPLQLALVHVSPWSPLAPATQVRYIALLPSSTWRHVFNEKSWSLQLSAHAVSSHLYCLNAAVLSWIKACFRCSNDAMLLGGCTNSPKVFFPLMLSTQVLVKDPDVSDCKQDPTSMVRAVPAPLQLALVHVSPWSPLAPATQVRYIALLPSSTWRHVFNEKSWSLQLSAHAVSSHLYCLNAAAAWTPEGARHATPKVIPTARAIANTVSQLLRQSSTL